MSNEELQKKVRELEQRLAKMEKVNEEVESLKERNRYLEEQNRLLYLLHFGPKSEKWTETDKLNSTLFNEAEDEAFKQSLNPVNQKPETEEKTNKRKKRGVSITSKLPDDLPSREVVYLLNDHEKICGCGAPLKHIGFDTVKRLDIKPAEITVIIEKHEKGACKQCDGIDLDKDDAPAIRRAEGKKHLIPGGIATAGLIAWSLSEKYEFALPFYRREKRFKHIGVSISRGNLCNWAIKAAESCAPLMSLITKQIKSGSVLNADETHIQVLKEKGRKPQNKSWMWLFKGRPPGKPAVLFQYDTGRSAQIPKVFLADYKGWLQTDGYTAYHSALRSLNKDRPDDQKIHHALCWAHARRRFEKCWKTTKSPDADEALQFIRDIFKLEKLREDRSEDQFSKERKNKAEDIFTDFRKWLEELYPVTLPKSLLGKAMKYTMNNWELLINYVEHPELTPSNNGAENSIRPFVIGRKNFLFSDTPAGADSSATIYSLIETAKLYDLIPFHYLLYVFDRLPYADTEEDYVKLLPWNLTKELILPPTT